MHRANRWKSWSWARWSLSEEKISWKNGVAKTYGVTHSHTGLLLTPTYPTVVLVYVYIDVRQGIPLHILPTTVKTGVVCRPSEPEWGTRKPLPHVSPGQPPLAMKQINSLRQSELRKRERERERKEFGIDSKRMEEEGRSGETERKTEDGGFHAGW